MPGEKPRHRQTDDELKHDEKTPYQRFEDLARKLLKVPKEEVDKEREKREREKRAG